MPKEATINLVIESKQKKQLSDLAKSQDRTLSSMLRIIIQQYLESRKQAA